ncbi:MAG TPA: thiamine pyrophosphate-binding protein [Opitutaceae bacterium]|nr:thiamine pyrophosphate-binding protein [Opitutaceae bacterium]
MKLSDYVVDFIARLGVKHVFMLPGGGAMHLNDSLGRHHGLEYVCVVHEQGGAIAAEAYGQAAGLGVLMVTTGPGGTNAITGVAGAWLESTPLLVISGQVKRADLVGGRGVRQIGFQEIDIVKLVAPITKYAVTVVEPGRIRAQLEEAAWHATHGRKGPVWVDVPLDVQAAQIDPAALEGFRPPPDNSAPSAAVQAAARRTIELLRQAKRPVVLAGNGLRHAGAVEDFLRWVESARIPVLTTWKALDFLPDDHPLYVGRPGAVGQRAANFAQQTSDLFISLGARLDFGQTAYNHANFAARAKKVIVDIDPAELAKFQAEIAVPLAADAGTFVRELASVSESLPDWGDWIARCRSWKERYPLVLPEYRSVPSGVHNYVFVDVLGRLLGRGDLLVPSSSGACSEVTCQALPAMSGIRFINTQGLGAMGFGVPAALGACLASGGRRTVCIDGDGGFPMNAQELAVVARLKLPIKFFVLNNAGYGSIRTTQINYFEKRFVACDAGSGLALPDLEKTAQACGIPFRRIESQQNLAAAIAEVLDWEGPMVCDVVMVPGQFTQPKVSSRQEADGRMATMPMEDLWPFLDREELAANLRS